MRKNSVGYLIRKGRENKGLSMKQAARALQITEGYLKHLEYNNKVLISERLVQAAHDKLGVPLQKLRLKAIGFNARARRHREKYAN